MACALRRSCPHTINKIKATIREKITVEML